MADNKYKKGDKVDIVAGKYCNHKEGTFVRYAGSVSADVIIKNDTVKERCLRLTSIRLKKGVSNYQNNKEDNKEELEFVLTTRTKVLEVIQVLEATPIESEEVEMKIEEGVLLLQAMLAPTCKFMEEEIKKAGAWRSDVRKDYTKK